VLGIGALIVLLWLLFHSNAECMQEHFLAKQL
jgi:hypothetical protein